MRAVVQHDRCFLFHGDSAELGLVLPENSVDSIVTDPPAGFAFMGLEWDEDKGGRDEWVKWLAELLAPAFRALKPGGHALVWAIPRTSHWTATALEDAGFEIRDVHHHIFGSGMPKSLDLRRQVDMYLCELPGRHCDKHLPPEKRRRPDDHLCPEHPRRAEVGASRTALKPAVEHWILARKPFRGTYAENVLEHGTGGLNVEECRIEYDESGPPPAVYSGAKGAGAGQVYGASGKYESSVSDEGRWPAHLSLEHCEACVLERWEEDRRGGGGDLKQRDGLEFGMAGRPVEKKTTRVPVYRCVLGCPVRLLNEQSGAAGANAPTTGDEPSAAATGVVMGARKRVKGKFHGDAGGAARFFYVAKAPRSEKDEGLDHLEKKTGGEATNREDDSIGTKNPRAGAGRGGGARNFHPTVKSIELMRWLVRLVTPPGGIVLDVFAGSGTTGVAALAEGLSFVGVEQGGKDGEYIPIAEGRLKRALAEFVEFAPVVERPAEKAAHAAAEGTSQ